MQTFIDICQSLVVISLMVMVIAILTCRLIKEATENEKAFIGLSVIAAIFFGALALAGWMWT